MAHCIQSHSQRAKVRCDSLVRPVLLVPVMILGGVKPLRAMTAYTTPNM